MYEGLADGEDWYLVETRGFLPFYVNGWPKFYANEK